MIGWRTFLEKEENWLCEPYSTHSYYKLKVEIVRTGVVNVAFHIFFCVCELFLDFGLLCVVAAIHMAKVTQHRFIFALQWRHCHHQFVHSFI